LNKGEKMKEVVALAALVGFLIAGCASKPEAVGGTADSTQQMQAAQKDQPDLRTESQSPAGPAEKALPERSRDGSEFGPGQLFPVPKQTAPDDDDSSPQFFLPLQRNRSYSI
jgi:hypothetical protein